VIVVDESKHVAQLGSRAPVPVEVTRFAWRRTQRVLESLGCRATLRRRDSEPFVTDNGNYILDCAFGPIANPAALEAALDRIPGVVESGLFVGLTHVVVTGRADGVEVVDRRKTEDAGRT
ncbi:MAG: ribose-5-phosphate isomerase A, partial [Chloroflexi bacterium]|nr:ribose-5-phosphate isomerase A [Chloroflexota bacterium]